MATSLKAYADAALSSVVHNPNILQRVDGSTGAVDFAIYLGSFSIGKKIEAASNPGVDDVVLSVSDVSPGDGQPATSVKLALTGADLDTAIAGAGLTIAPTILSGAAGAVAVHVRAEAGVLVSGTFEDLSITTNDLVESNA